MRDQSTSLVVAHPVWDHAQMLGRAAGYLVASGILFVAWLRWVQVGEKASTRWAESWVRMYPTVGSDRIEYNDDDRLRAATVVRRFLLVALPILVVVFAAAGVTYLGR